MGERDSQRKTHVLKGIGVSPGVATGKALILDYSIANVPCYQLGSEAETLVEISRFEKALKESRRQLAALRKKLSDREGPKPLFIMDVHMMMLKDKTLINNTVNVIKERMINAEWALMLTIDKYREIFEKIDDEYLRERFSDVEYVGQRILRNLVGREHIRLADIEEASIIISKDLSPADTVQMKVENILGFATDMGGKTSHTAIVARSIGIPAVVGLERVTREVRPGDIVVVDGLDGFVIVNPDPELIRRYEEKKRHFEILEEGLLREARLPAVTRDNRKVDISANIEFVEEIPSAVAHGAEGVGLYRTEFIYINREQLPTEDEHFVNYRSVIEGQGIKWSTIRTFDLGGDKFISDPKLAKEMNPVMGLRAIRFCLQEIELFKVQLRAILRASAYGKTRVLF
ncbi:MAG TPA: phosphoenolpyruvate--protein phosphotransferase, partial [Syntrophales bacterium]|nr:phosphoenolpyruvate--protein phosphotransferase [Syntrophales bacterium]